MRRLSDLLILAVAIVALVSCSDSTAPSASPTVLGSTPGWFNGDEVQFDYTKQFECKTPPAAGSDSGCELGADAETEPSHTTDIPELYVMVPMGFTPDPSTLHCPTAGNCVTHPHDLDLSRVFGAGTEKAPLAAHSHIIITLEDHRDVPWKIEVIGVKDLNTWNTIVATENLSEVRLLQLQDPNETRITSDISTNTFLFFRVR
ncbi:MAG: hypothetical protein ACRENK_13775 [Gemmatimonadaceae bacterium]